jgi:hypothetical protein
VACSIHGASSFELDITDVEGLGGGSVRCVGTFQMTATDGTIFVDLSGSFNAPSMASR